MTVFRKNKSSSFRAKVFFDFPHHETKSLFQLFTLVKSLIEFVISFVDSNGGLTTNCLI